LSNNAPAAGPRARRPYTAQSLERGLLALAALRDSPHAELSLTELAQHVGLHKSTVHRLLVTLERNGFVEQDGRTRRYGLGLAFLEFAHRAVDRLEVRRHALRVMHALAVESGESVYLSVLSGGQTVCVEEVVPPRGVTLGSNLGVALPLHRTGSGKCFLAWTDAATAEGLFGRGTDGTGPDWGALGAELARVRRAGFAVNDEETEPGVRYAAAPIFGSDGQVVATLSLGVPVLRGRPAAFARLCRAAVAAAGRVSASLGFRETATAARRAEGETGA
jgi:DNA-binding IclR family transcriptional regulator